MSKTAFITGITGMDGFLLSNFLLKKGYKIVGLVRKQSSYKIQNNPDIKYLLGDLNQIQEVLTKISDIEIDEFYMLGGQTSIEPSWEDFVYTFDTNVSSLVQVLEYIRKNSIHSKLFYASSSEIFGNPFTSPQNENTDKHPRNPYGLSKLMSQNLVQFYREKYNVFACCGILYNHECEYRRRDVVTKKISSTVAKIHLGLESELIVGNIKNRRDWTSAKDFIEGMWMTLQHFRPDDYIFSSNESREVRELIEVAFKCVGIDNWEKYLKIDERFYRDSEKFDLVGDNTKLKSIGWEPKISFETMIKDMVYSDIEKEKNSL